MTPEQLQIQFKYRRTAKQTSNSQHHKKQQVSVDLSINEGIGVFSSKRS